jgi:hypothetical protein
MPFPASTDFDSDTEPAAPQRGWLERMMPIVLIGGGLLSLAWSGLLAWTLVDLIF